MTNTMTNDTTPNTLLLLFWRDLVAQLRQVAVQTTADDSPEALSIFYTTTQRIERIEQAVDWMASEENAHISPDTPLYGRAMRLVPKLCLLALHGNAEAFDKFVGENDPMAIER